jgi:Amt family ammonium transporter
MAGNYADGTTPGKVQFGSGWWFVDQKEGMEWQINALSNLGLLSRFIGMLTDSRSFMSFPRHEYFRRTLCILLGKRQGFGKDKMAPHSMVLCMVGTGMLWVGWYGFNAGSALAADGVAANAFMTTTLAAATAGFVWALIEGLHRGKPSILGFCSGIVGGLVVITPACGFVTANGAMVIGLLAGIIPYIFVAILKSKLGYDDALDTFGVHAVGGTLGAILTGFLATSDANANLLLADYAGKNGLAKAGADGAFVLDKSALITGQFTAIGITLVISIVATIVIAMIVKAVVGLRPTPEDEAVGLDLAEHGEAGYEH